MSHIKKYNTNTSSSAVSAQRNIYHHGSLPLFVSLCLSISSFCQNCEMPRLYLSSIKSAYFYFSCGWLDGRADVDCSFSPISFLYLIFLSIFLFFCHRFTYFNYLKMNVMIYRVYSLIRLTCLWKLPFKKNNNLGTGRCLVWRSYVVCSFPTTFISFFSLPFICYDTFCQFTLYVPWYVTNS